MLATRYIRMDFTSQEDFEKNYELRIRNASISPTILWTNMLVWSRTSLR